MPSKGEHLAYGSAQSPTNMNDAQVHEWRHRNLEVVIVCEHTCPPADRKRTLCTSFGDKYVIPSSSQISFNSLRRLPDQQYRRNIFCVMSIQSLQNSLFTEAFSQQRAAR